MNLRKIVEKYLAIAGGYGFPAAIAEFQMEPGQAERLFSAFDEDYHISRYLHFSEISGPAFAISGFNQTHVTVDAEIESVL